ncbi:succinate-semialdehyde dehydrogenase [Niallia circulans]|uniref:aldehyde dehydrogenase family protein n=1 Tax=Niallia TaxID=2837506 RepID=UPI00077C9591|nr:aldehyde dehydrogenase family protein [Niallia circulans]MCM2982108.1 aldehyde dehydrogenase family protein [Niallia circulans]MDR4318472.1 aldehyde dehydrogenase family protein [Niallia circulans]MED3841449.1 aldehyde dehydrogenase family protein [Niallia circulans]MED4243512.1 aldehyde dehydrogenase family protein [Niallia circulans]MED4248437.1 aldehyde dehydrogenase family protein [Niallia circulans]
MQTEPITIHAIINGEKVPTEKQAPRENPTHPDEIVGYAPLNTKEETVLAIDAAYDALKGWAWTDVDERIERMERAIQKLKDATPEIATLLSREHGKALYDSKGEIAISIMWMEFACKNVKKVVAPQEKEHENGRTIITFDPVGVVSAISPWNYPISLSTIKIAPALLTGNTMVVKPSPFAPLAVSKVVEIIAEEFPPGVLNLVHGDAEVGVELTSNPKVAKIAFTGGTKTAKSIMKAASETIKKMTLELGGNDAAIVLKDFDVNDEKAMRRMVISNFLTAGQICMIAKRIYVHRSIYDAFVEKYIEAANKWIRVGDPFHPDVTVGPVNNKNQVKYVKSLVEDAKSKGAKVIPLGEILNPELMDNGYFLQPTLVLGADFHDPIVVEEQFGPTVPILPFDDEEQVIELHNESIYGLTSSVWGEEEHAIKVARRIEAGTTMINTAAVQGLDVRFPFGGVKQSGVGREYGEEGLKSYVETHVINIPKTLELPYIPE